MNPIITYNIKHSPNSVNILEFLVSKYIDPIICVQESTHCELDNYVCEKSSGKYPYNLTTYIPKNIQYTRFPIDLAGMVLHIRIIYNEQPIDIFNVHIQNGNPHTGKDNARRLFDIQFNKLIEEWPNNNIIIAGDFNCCIYNGDHWNHPKSGRDPKKIDEQRLSITNLINKVDLYSMSRYHNPTKPIHELRTFISHRCKIRDFEKHGWTLDHIFCTKSLNNIHKNCVVLQDIIYSDHVPIIWHSYVNI